MGAPHQVWARAAWALVDVAQAGGVEQDGLFRGLPFDDASMRRQKRIAWSDYCVLVERLEERTAEAGGLVDLLEGGYHQVFPEARALVALLTDSKPLVRFMMEIVGPMIFPPVEIHYEDLGGPHVRVTIQLREGARGCEAWFRGSIGGFRCLPRYLDLPPAEVSARIAPDSGVYDVLLPSPRSLAQRARGAFEKVVVRFVLGMGADGAPVGGTLGELGGDGLEGRLAAAVQAWKLTPRQAEVFEQLVQGLSNKEIATAFGCAENTVELHVTQILRKSGTPGRNQLIARFWAGREG